MKNYSGRDSADPPLGGGQFPRAQGFCGEECNFVPADDGDVYGHFETIKRSIDRQVLIERLGAGRSDNFIDDVDVVWTAPENGEGARVVVGWYRCARVYRCRQNHEGNEPSETHRRDDIRSFRTRARAENALLLPPHRRTLRLGRGRGWSGQASWWYAEDTGDLDAKAFVREVKAAMNANSVSSAKNTNGNASQNGKGRSGAATANAYARYVRDYEIQVHPQHDRLQELFINYLRDQYESVQFLPCFRDDLRYSVKGRPIMVEIKPADPGMVRFAIRAAIGQLLDYRQHQKWSGAQLILVGAKVTRADDLALAADNGFGLAWPVGGGDFEVRWP